MTQVAIKRNCTCWGIGTLILLLNIFAQTALLSGCTTYGGKKQRFTLTTDPPGATVYVLPYLVWLEHGGAKILEDDELLESFRIKSGLTPVTASKQPYEHVFVADWDGHREFDRFRPRAGNVYHIAHPRPSERKASGQSDE